MSEFFVSRTLQWLKLFVVPGVMLAFIQPVYSFNSKSAVGFWKAVDDKTHKVSSVIQIWEDKKTHKLSGKIYNIIPDQSHKGTEVCVACPGKQQNKPMLGLQIIRGMTFSEGKYRGGHILDPRNGKEYHASMRLEDHGMVLKLRGYVGIPLFGKTATWYRTFGANV